MLVFSKLTKYIKQGSCINQIYNGYIKGDIGTTRITYIRNDKLDFMVIFEEDPNESDNYFLQIFYKYHKFKKYNRLGEFYRSIFYNYNSRLFLDLLVMLIEKYVDCDDDQLCKSCILTIDSMRIIYDYNFVYDDDIEEYILDIEY